MAGLKILWMCVWIPCGIYITVVIWQGLVHDNVFAAIIACIAVTVCNLQAIARDLKDLSSLMD